MHEMDSSTPGAPTVMVVDAGDVFVGGRYHSLVPILRFGFLVLNHGVHVIPASKNKAFDWYSDDREEYEGGRDFYHAVAVIKKGSLTNVRNLKVPNIIFLSEEVKCIWPLTKL